MHKLLKDLVDLQKWLQESQDHCVDNMGTSHDYKLKEQTIRIINEKLGDVILEHRTVDVVDRKEIVEAIKKSQVYYEGISRYDYSAGFEKSIYIVGSHNKKDNPFGYTTLCTTYKKKEECGWYKEEKDCLTCIYRVS